MEETVIQIDQVTVRFEITKTTVDVSGVFSIEKY